MPAHAAPTTIQPLLDGLADRIARRDLPPPPPGPDYFTPDHVLARIAAALPALLPRSTRRGFFSQARMLLSFLTHETQTSSELGRTAGLARLATSRAHNALVACGLLHGAYQGPRRAYRLTRWGEDWLLAVGKGEVPPVRPT